MAPSENISSPCRKIGYLHGKYIATQFFFPSFLYIFANANKNDLTIFSHAVKTLTTVIFL